MRDNLVQIPQHVNGWEDCGNDGLSYWKYKGERVYSFISREWLDQKEDDKNIYAICSNDIDLKEMSLHDIECAICGYYDSIEEMEKKTGCKFGELDYDIAYEEYNNNISSSVSWGGTFTLEEANQKIFEYMMEN